MLLLLTDWHIGTITVCLTLKKTAYLKTAQVYKPTFRYEMVSLGHFFFIPLAWRWRRSSSRREDDLSGDSEKEYIFLEWTDCLSESDWYYWWCY